MLQGLIFFGVVLFVAGSIHWYLWRRLVKDTTRPGRWRRIGTIATFVLVGALVAAFVMPRALGVREGFVFALIGYLWLAVMFYLLVVLLALELPRLALRLMARRTVTVRAAAGTMAGGNGAGESPGGTAAERGGDSMAAERGGDSTAAERGAGVTPAEQGAGVTAAGDERGAVGRRNEGGGPFGEGEATGVGADDGMSRRLVLARGAAIFAGLTATGLVGYGVKTALGPPVLKRVQIPLAKLPRGMDGYRIALVSDIHLGPLTGLEHSRRIVDAINGMNADLVAIVGDLVDGSVAELGRDAAPLRDLRSRDGSYFVTGNHEYYSGVDEWVDELGRLNVRVLLNERVEIRGLDLAGVNDVAGGDFSGGNDGQDGASGQGASGPGVSGGQGATGGQGAGGPGVSGGLGAMGAQGARSGPDFGKALGDRDPGKAVVLLAHQPVQAREAAKYKVDLQLSGHTHGGQMVPFNLVARLQQPVISGLGEVDGTKVYVTNGAGFWGPPVRVGAPPDITLVELRAG